MVKKTFIKIRNRRRSLPVQAVCRNCGESLYGPFCSQCGQHLMKGARRTVRDLSFNMTENVFSFDDKIFTTIIYLLFVPGKLTREYMKGRIVSYVHPSKLFWFISIIFFTLLTIAIDRQKERDKENADKQIIEAISSLQSEKKVEAADNLKAIEASASSIGVNSARAASNPGAVKENVKSISDDVKSIIVNAKQLEESQKAQLADTVAANIAAKSKKTTTQERSDKDKEEDGDIFDSDKFLTVFKTYAPYAAFFMIPVFAGIVLMLFYKKENFFVDYFAFSMHFHAFVFLMLTILIVIDYFKPDLEYPEWMFFIPAIYFLRAAWVVYRPKLWGLLWKTSLVVMLYGISILVFTILFIINIAWIAGLDIS